MAISQQQLIIITFDTSLLTSFQFFENEKKMSEMYMIWIKLRVLSQWKHLKERVIVKFFKYCYQHKPTQSLFVNHVIYIYIYILYLFLHLFFSLYDKVIAVHKK